MADSAAPERVPADEFQKPLHRVEWTVEKESISGKVICDAGPQGWCRMVCTEGCESFDLRDGHEHPFRYEDECQVELWLNADCPTLTYWWTTAPRDRRPDQADVRGRLLPVGLHGRGEPMTDSAARRSWIPADAKHIDIRRLIEVLQATVDDNPDVRFVTFVDTEGYEYAPLDAGRIMPDDMTAAAGSAHLEMGLFKP